MKIIQAFLKGNSDSDLFLLKQIGIWGTAFLLFFLGTFGVVQVFRTGAGVGLMGHGSQMVGLSFCCNLFRCVSHCRFVKRYGGWLVVWNIFYFPIYWE